MSRGALSGGRVVLGVSGGIAAYKAVELCRRLMDGGADVKVAMTADATRFVTALTFSALSGHPAGVSLWDGPDPIPHTRLGQWAELVVVAPATARLLGAYAAGISDDLLTATLLATRAPVVVCPAMHAEMWEHPAVQDNMAVLRGRGVTVVEPAVGRLAGGDAGPGRMADVALILAAAEAVLSRQAAAPAITPRPQDLSGRRVLITAGGTREPIDPVRFLGNRSSGKQGHALAAAAEARGAAVTLVTTAGAERSTPARAEVVTVETAAEMAAAVNAHAARADVIIMAAAVADFRPKAVADQKLKRADGVPDLVLEPTPDILARLTRSRPPGQLVVGFAAETAAGAQLRENARDKLRRKHLDLVVANDVSAPGTGFGHETNAVVIVTADGDSIEVARTDKTGVANAVLDAVAARLPAHE
ncbi:MAG: bifunctional phosphopantothenoylcysteine decarboxylase/phosphopantothenate--cysteine ligase CoaBC [Actinomycetota bacterium]|nr:bifunctional phosphopantothenoylcysteine decarboxylase/phosphopantothenate--cysteine ligase CoaBC [Actinomycetota bacterium]